MLIDQRLIYCCDIVCYSRIRYQIIGYQHDLFRRDKWSQVGYQLVETKFIVISDDFISSYCYSVTSSTASTPYALISLRHCIPSCAIKNHLDVTRRPLIVQCLQTKQCNSIIDVKIPSNDMTPSYRISQFSYIDVKTVSIK